METKLTDTYAPENIKTAKYVLVEMASKEKPLDKTLGLFMGINPVVKSNTALASTDELFVFLWRDPIIHMMNLDRYYIKSIEVGECEGSIGTSNRFFSAADQHECIEKLKAVQAAFKTADRMVDGELIDTDKYIVPKSITDKIKEARSSIPAISTGSPVKSSGVTDWQGSQPHHTAACGYSGYNGITYASKTVTTSWIQRSSKYPIEAAIHRMRTKIAEIKAGTYKPPQLLEIPADKKEKEAADEKKVTSQQTDSIQNASTVEPCGTMAEHQRRMRAMAGIDNDGELDPMMWAGML